MEVGLSGKQGGQEEGCEGEQRLKCKMIFQKQGILKRVVFIS